MSSELSSPIEINLNTSGITIFSENLSTPRFIPFDQKGRCPVCKSDNVEIDYILQPQGITIYCSRLKQEKFVAFDKNVTIGENSTVKLKSRSRCYNVPLKREILDDKNTPTDP